MDHMAASEVDIEEGPLSDDESVLDERKRQQEQDQRTGMQVRVLQNTETLPVRLVIKAFLICLS